MLIVRDLSLAGVGVDRGVDPDVSNCNVRLHYTVSNYKPTPSSTHLFASLISYYQKIHFVCPIMFLLQHKIYVVVGLTF